MKQLRNLTLELSTKALHDPSPDAVERVARLMFRQWRTLAEHADTLSVLLWTSDGSELLDWSGDFSDTFEWACWCGCANHRPQPENPTPRQLRNTHCFPRKMFSEEECAPRPYAWLRDAVAIIRAAARTELGRDIRVGTTFDNGPEFAISDFKFNRHREAMLGGTLFPHSLLACYATLHADTRRYAAFPGGIPEGLSVGSFLGAQYKAFARDFGFDYIWLFNGMGFGKQPWGITGSLFDKKEFHPERMAEESERMRRFWRDFFDACPDAVVETRGSNMSAGVEIATDAAPLGELYAAGSIEPPVNSPWAALNFNTGLELAAWMSHVAELPKGRGFPFRFYIHDPWFLNSPWLDRYAREPWDIFAPLSIARLREDGSVQTPDSIAFLTVDDTLGRMPEQVPREVTPLLQDAFETAPDQPGPLVWVYPFEEYAAIVSRRDAETQREKAGGDGCKVKEEALPRIFNEDFFLGEALQGGLPLNTVVSTRVWRKLANGAEAPRSDIFVVPVSALMSQENLAALDAYAAKGAHFLVYGSLAGAPAALLDRLGLALAEPLDGELSVSIAPELAGDTFSSGALAARISVTPAFDGGPLAETLPHPDAQTLPYAIATSHGGAQRVLAARRGQFAYVRSISPCDGASAENRPHYFDYAPASQVFPVERLLRHVLGAAFGWRLLAEAHAPDALLPRTNISRHDNAFVFVVYAPDTTASMRVRTPFGAPLLTERETLLTGGDAIWHPDKTWRRECRLFADGQKDGVVSVKTNIAAYPGYTGHLRVTGLENATLRFFPPAGFEKTVELVRSEWNLLGEDVLEPEWEETAHGRCAVWRGLTGAALIAW